NRIVNNLFITFYTLRAAEFKENLYFLIGGMGCTEPTVSEITAVYPNSSSTSTSCKFGSGNSIVQLPKGALFLSVGQYHLQ
ncbi:hypothetical protein, partial [Acinetobacter baumannii]|uniref:hypothetical protein n=1 Tax=Acinetobacter baumannii TaxID=470 RepID=UPI001C45FAEE